MSSHRTTRGPSEIPADASRTDVTDADEFRQELIRLAEDRDANDWEMLEDRASQLLSDIRRTRPDEDDEEGDGDE